MAYDIGPKIGIDGEAEFRKELNNITEQMKTLGTEMKAVTSEFDENDQSQEKLAAQSKVLTRQVELQEQKLAELRKGLEKSADMYGENDTKTLKWKSTVNMATANLNKMRRQLEKNESAMSGLSGETDALGGNLKDLAADAGSFGDGFGGAITGLMDDLGKLKGALVGGAIVTGIKELGESILSVEENTREFRQIMGGLEVSSAAAGYTAEQTTEAYNRLYGVLGDTQTAATTVANLQAIGLSQEDLMTIVDMATGAWATYGDSIPIDGLSESINETIQAGKVTGNFADVLNWAGTSEDEFNKKLEAANSSSERANIVMEELARQGLTDTAQAYRDNNDAIIKANESQLLLDEAWGKMGEAVAPVADALRNVGASAIEWLAEKVDEAVEALKDLGEWWDKTKKAFRELSQMSFGDIWDKMWEMPDGSHANGLRYVPFDGYVAELHRGERVLTASEAATLNSLQAGMTRQPRAVTAADLQSVAAQTANAMSAMQGAGVQVPSEIMLKLTSDDGTVFGRWLVPIVRSENKSNPEVVSDRL